MEEPNPMPRRIGEALLLWIAFVLVFVIFGGVGAGLTALIYELIFDQQFNDILYAIVFGVNGFIAYRLAQRIVDAD